jgi:hypothetical protein
LPVGMGILVGNVVIIVTTGVVVRADVQEARTITISRAAIKVRFIICTLFWQS